LKLLFYLPVKNSRDSCVTVNVLDEEGNYLGKVSTVDKKKQSITIKDDK
jgi:hypothetical protein